MNTLQELDNIEIIRELDKPAQRTFYIKNFVQESNLIEGIQRAPSKQELAAHDDFLRLQEVTISDLEVFVGKCQPEAKLRDKVGMNVVIGNAREIVHRPPPVGQGIVYALEMLLNEMQRDELKSSPVQSHALYESLHPFTDCNGRSGRVLWLWHWQHLYCDLPRLGFLHQFYYETLSYVRGG